MFCIPCLLRKLSETLTSCAHSRERWRSMLENFGRYQPIAPSWVKEAQRHMKANGETPG